MQTLFMRCSQGLMVLLSQWRYLKFGLVGASGTLVNLGVLYACQEFVLQGIEATQRLYASLAVAIFLATVNNFFWNRRWTWRDRLLANPSSAVRQFVRYGLASWLGTCVQYVLTLWLATHWHYLGANVVAIVVASVVNYFANDWWTFQAQPRIVPMPELRARYERVSGLLLLLAVLVYAFDLGGENIPRNGDELVYAHIAFKTWLQAQQSGAWLPLVSDLGHMRNTKPPLLFWQAMSVGRLHLDWQLLWLRLPSLLYTLASTACVVWAARGLARASQTPDESVWTPRSLGHLAGLFFLAFFSTYRYGRPYLTSAIETFWMGLPVWVLFAWQLHATSAQATSAQLASSQPASAQSAMPHRASQQTQTDATWMIALFVSAGLGMGAVALYKSFVLIVPMAGALFLALSSWQPSHMQRWWWAISACVLFGLACFGLWFALDPDPQSVWREFVIGENLGKMDQGGPSYWQTAMSGGFSIWWQALAVPQNALLLAPLVALVLWRGVRQVRVGWRLHRAHPVASLWWFVLVMHVFFMLPSQRSSRYLIPVMPMVAVLCATQIWQWSASRHRLSLGLSTLLCALSLGVLGVFLWAGWRIDLYPLWGRMGLCLMLGLQVLALMRLMRTLWPSTHDATRATARLHASWLWLLGWVIALYAWFGMLSAPLHTASNQYNADTQQQLSGQRLAVPSYFNGDFERWRFLLPRVAQITPYAASELRLDDPSLSADTQARLQNLLAQNDAVVVHVAWSSAPIDCQALGCVVVQERIALRGRHKPGEINTTRLHTPENLLFWHEYVLQAAPAKRP